MTFGELKEALARGTLLEVAPPELRPLFEHLAPILERAPEQLAPQLAARVRGRLGDEARAAASGMRPLRPSFAPPPPERTPFEPVQGRQINAVVAVGDHVVSASEDGTLVLWSEGRRRTLEAHAGPVNAIATDPEGHTIATAGDDRTVRLWDTRSWSVACTIEGHDQYVRDVALGRACVVSGCDDAWLRFFDRDGIRRAAHEAHAGGVFAVELDPTEALVATCGMDNAIRLWSSSGEALGALYESDGIAASMGSMYIALPNTTGIGHRQPPHHLRWLDDGGLLSIGQEVIRWEPVWVDGSVVVRERWRRKLAWPPDDASLRGGRLLVGGTHDVALIDVDTGEVALSLEAPERGVSAVSWVDDQRALVGSRRGVLALWSIDPAEAHEHHVGWVSTTQVGGGLAVTSDSAAMVKIWDVATGRLLRTLDPHPESGTRPLCLSPDGTRLVTLRQDDSPKAFLWDPTTGEKLADFDQDEPRLSPNGAAFLPDGDIVIASVGEGLVRWTPGSGGRLLDGFTKHTSSLVVDPSGRWLVANAYLPIEGGGTFDNLNHLQGWDLERGARRWSVSAEKVERFSGSFGLVAFVGSALVTTMGRKPDMLVRRDVETGAVLDELAPVPWVACHAVHGTKLWVMVHETDDAQTTLLCVDVETGSVDERKVEGQVMNGVIVPERNEAFVRLDDDVARLSLATGEVVERLTLDRGVSGLAFDALRSVLVVSGRDGRVTMLAV